MSGSRVVVYSCTLCHSFVSGEGKMIDMLKIPRWMFLSLLSLLLGQLSLLEAALFINGTNCTGYIRTVNESIRVVECPPAVDTVQLPVVEAAWEIILSKRTELEEICRKVVIYRNQSVVLHHNSILLNNQTISPKLLVNTSMSVAECDRRYKAAYNTTRSSRCCQDKYHRFLSVDRDNGSLIIDLDSEKRMLSRVTHLQGRSANCSVTGSKGQTANSSFTFTVQSDKQEVRPQYSKASPRLPADSNTPLPWHINVGSSDILCVTVEVSRKTKPLWNYNGTGLNITEVPIATERCTDCRQKECIKEAERMARLNSTHPPVAIVGRWETPCFGTAPSTITLMSFVRVADANLEDSGYYVVQFTKEITQFSQEYHVTVDWLHETSFIEEPSREMTVLEGHNLRVPCVINTAADTNLSQVYWSFDSNVQQPIDRRSLSEGDAAVNYSSEEACTQYGRRNTYTIHSRRVRDESGAVLLEVSLNLYLCNVQLGDRGVFRCWHGNDSSRSMMLHVNRDPRLVVATAVVSVIASILVTVLIALIAIAVWCGRRGLLKRHQADIPLDFGPDFSQLSGFHFMQMATTEFRDEAEPEMDNWEFPRENLHPLEVLGQGNFGKVLKARAMGILPDRPGLNVVAVKVVKGDPPQPSAVDDLWAELQLMKALKPHPNIVNLLGQCTQPDGPLCIIMEFAPLGSLKDFLKECCKLLQLDKQKHKGKVYTQHCPPAQQSISSYFYVGGQRNGAHASHEAHHDKEDPFRTYAKLYMNVPSSGSSVMQSDSGCGCSERDCSAYRTSLAPLRQARSTSTPSYGYVGGGSSTRGGFLSESESNYVGGHQLTVSSSGYCGSDHMQISSEVRSYWSQQGKPKSVASSWVSSGYSSSVGTANGTSSAGESPYYTTNAGLLKDVDLFNIGAQVARGMEHLRKMKCVHRDLAARNVLIADNFILKVADFGLARDTEEKNYYRRMTFRPLPARWMALESLIEGKHTIQGDVWSYGVLLWEVLTYGKVPYMGVPAATSFRGLTEYLQTGARLEKPPGCSDPMYQLLQACWEEEEERRPSFSDLIDIFEKAMQLTQDHDLLPDLDQDKDTLSSPVEPHSGDSYPLLGQSPHGQFVYIPLDRHRTLTPGVEVTDV